MNSRHSLKNTGVSKSGALVRGMHRHRLKDNPKEAAFARAWLTLNQQGEQLEYMLSPDNRPAFVGDEKHEVAATVIQWLGSPVGQEFLKDVEDDEQ